MAKLKKRSFIIPLENNLIKPPPAKTPKTRKIKKTRKKQTKKSLDKRDKLAIKIYCNMTDTKNAQYFAYMQAFKDKNIKGNIEELSKDIEDFFNNDLVKKEINNYRNKKHIIEDPSERRDKNGNNLGHCTSKLTEYNVQILEKAVSRGMSMRSAVTLVDIETITFFVWLKRGQEAINLQDFNSPYAKFYYRINKASAVGEITLLDCIHQASEMGVAETKTKVDAFGDIETITTQRKSWQAAAWILERTRKDQYSKMPAPLTDDEEANTVTQAKETYDALQLLITNSEPEVLEAEIEEIEETE